MRGFRVLDPMTEADRELPVVMAVSHYREEKYARMLSKAGFTHVIRLRPHGCEGTCDETS